MPEVFAALFFFAILTLWIPAYWPVAVFQVGVFTLAAIGIWRERLSPPVFTWPLVPLSATVLWGLLQVLTGRTAYAFDTQLAIVRSATFLSVYVVGISVFRDSRIRRWFRSAILWFAFVVAIIATLQTFTSNGKVFWLFDTGYPDYVMGPILNRNHYAVFIEAVLPIALYLSILRERQLLLYAGMAATMYASVIASASRAGAALCTAEIILVPLLLWIHGRVTGRNLVVASVRMALLFSVLTALVGWQIVWSRFGTADPLAGRRELATSTFHMAASHPWFGTGLGTWPVVYPQYAVVDIGASANQAHNDWLQWTAECGFPMGILLASLLVWSLRPAFRCIWGVGVVAVFLHALVDYPFSRPALGCWGILILSMLACKSTERPDSGLP